MSFYETLNELCKKNNTTISALLKTFNLSTGNTGSWKKGILPKGETLIQLASYFDVSVDYLLGRESPTKIEPSDAASLLDTYNKLNESGKQKLLETASDLAALPKYQK